MRVGRREIVQAGSVGRVVGGRFNVREPAEDLLTPHSACRIVADLFLGLLSQFADGCVDAGWIVLTADVAEQRH